MWSHFLPSSIDFTLLISLLKMEGSTQPVKGVRAQALTLITPVVAICPISPSFSLFFPLMISFIFPILLFLRLQLNHISPFLFFPSKPPCSPSDPQPLNKSYCIDLCIWIHIYIPKYSRFCLYNAICIYLFRADCCTGQPVGVPSSLGKLTSPTLSFPHLPIVLYVGMRTRGLSSVQFATSLDVILVLLTFG